MQTEGESVLPHEGMTFRGKSVAGVEGKADAYLANLELNEYEWSYDFSQALEPYLLQELDAAGRSRNEWERAQYQMVCVTYRTIKALKAAGFSVRDIAVFTALSKSEVQEISKKGLLYQRIEKEQDRKAKAALDAVTEHVHEMKAPNWYKGSSWQAQGILSPGAALAWEMALENLLSELQDLPFEETCLAGWLPDRFNRFYDQGFVKTFVGVLRAVHGRLVSGSWNRWETPAEEIAIAVLQESAAAVAEINFDLGMRIARKSDVQKVRDLRDYVVEDFDVDLLWGREYDGVEDDVDIMTFVGYSDELRFENWFKPYRSDHD
jgi:hypothetical protein